ncbi:unnamed protein product [Heligmosomoides polygyrus]|uniref:DNA-directed RNA polymerase n=1 Tax=Heligmosomoides polygyrus TaxID=6339 RepID=A0A3P7X844_HELPZ|nr:unnamed protein product [Heligmosomoides polygyrus]
MNHVDVDQLLEDYAWSHFKDIQSLRKTRLDDFKSLERDDCEFIINRKNLVCVNEDPQYNEFVPVGAKPYTLFKSIYTNNTNRPQEYSFKTERTTESLCSISREQGYTMGAEAELTLKTPYISPHQKLATDQIVGHPCSIAPCAEMMQMGSYGITMILECLCQLLAATQRDDRQRAVKGTVAVTNKLDEILKDWYLAGCPIRCGTSSEMDAERGRRVSAVIIPSRFAASERRVRFDASDDADGFRQQQREKLQPGAMSRGRVLPLDEFSAITEFLTPVRTKVVLMI